MGLQTPAGEVALELLARLGPDESRTGVAAFHVGAGAYMKEVLLGEGCDRIDDVGKTCSTPEPRTPL